MRDLCNAHMELHGKSFLDLQVARASGQLVAGDCPACPLGVYPHFHFFNHDPHASVACVERGAAGIWTH